MLLADFILKQMHSYSKDGITAGALIFRNSKIYIRCVQ